MRLREAGELEFLRRVRAAVGAPRGPLSLGIGDDAAVLRCEAGDSVLLKCDAAVAGQHFRREWLTEAEIGARAVRGALSDLAAMGGRPAALLLTLLVSPDEAVEAAEAVLLGAAAAAAEFGAQLAGGETVGTDGPLALDVILAGFVPTGRELRRSGARPGDVLLVSGTLGDSAAGLACLERGSASGAAAQHVIARWKRPEPRLALGELLVASGAVHAAIDVSDGLLRDTGHLAEESGVAARIQAGRLPLSPECREVAATLNADATAWALTGGEDFELLFAADPARCDGLRTEARDRLGLQLTAIGGIEAGHGVRVLRPDGREETPPTTGWDQFVRGD